MDISSIFGAVKNNLGPILKTITNNFGFFLGLLLMLFAALIFKQCNDINELNKENIRLELVKEREEQRLLNNINSLDDSITVLYDNLTYQRSITVLKESDVRYLSDRLIDAKRDFEKLSRKQFSNDTDVSELYVSDIQFEQPDGTANLNILETNDTLQFTVVDSNYLYRHFSEFSMVRLIDSNKVTFNPIKNNLDEFVRTDFDLNFTMQLSQIKLDDNSYRVLLNFKSADGEDIPPEVVNIPFLEGSKFIDIYNPFEQEIKVVYEQREPRRIVVSAGPVYGAFNTDSGIKLNFGLGIMLGYRIF